jgi:hypothetical protein
MNWKGFEVSRKDEKLSLSLQFESLFKFSERLSRIKKIKKILNEIEYRN